MTPTSLRLIFAVVLNTAAVIINVNACCTCDAWCRGEGGTGGICADGPHCICKGTDHHKYACTCDAWCRGRGHKGGKCCDGPSCSCHD